MNKILSLLFLSNITFATEYYHLDPSHLHDISPRLHNLTKVFDRGRMQIYQLKSNKTLSIEQQNYLKPIPLDSWKVISQIVMRLALYAFSNYPFRLGPISEILSI